MSSIHLVISVPEFAGREKYPGAFKQCETRANCLKWIIISWLTHVEWIEWMVESSPCLC